MASTIKDVAKAAGVSTATVSRVINNIGGYSKEVEERVLTVIKEVGYHKNENAISLVKNTSKIIGIVMPNVGTSFYMDIIKGIEDTARKKGYSIILTHAGIGKRQLKEGLNIMTEKRVAGMIIVSTFLKDEDINIIQTLNIPVLLISSKSDDSQIPYIKVDDYSASYAAVEYLINMGHRKIAFVGGSSTDPIAGIPRVNGYKDALLDYNIELDEELMEFGFFIFESGKLGMKSLLEKKVSITAVFCVSDETALGVISTCYANGIKVPEDLSVIGYDNSAISSMATPALTTIAQPFYDMGSLGCENLIDAILTGKKIDSQIVPFKIVERQTVKKLS